MMLNESIGKKSPAKGGAQLNTLLCVFNRRR